MNTTKQSRHRSDAAVRSLVARMLSVAGCMLSEGALAAPGTDTDLAADDPKAKSSQAQSSNSTGLPRSVVYGALAGLFLLVAGGAGAHKKRHP